MAEFQVGDKTYRSGKLSAMTQFHMVRRLAPLLGGIGAAAAAVRGQIPAAPADPAASPLPSETFLQADIIAMVADAVGKMSDQDTEYVINTCLSVCQRQQEGNVWAPVTRSGRMMFEDIDMAQMLQITWRVLQENLSSFFNAPQLSSIVGGRPSLT